VALVFNTGLNRWNEIINRTQVKN